MSKTQTAPQWNDLPDGSDALAGAFLAGDYHGGQFTALYALASAGSFELYAGEGTGRLLRELTVAIAMAEDADEWEDVHYLMSLRDWLREW